jgi:type I restriction enzyme, S subunit
MSFRSITTVYGPMSEDFLCQSLDSLCVKDNGIQTGPFGSLLHQEDYVVEGTPIITVEHLGENRIVDSNVPCVSDTDLERLARFQLEDGDIVFSRVGSVDRRALVRAGESGWLFSGRCLRVRPNPELVDSEYLSYFFGLQGYKYHINQIAVGATMPSLNTKILSDLPIYYPPLPEQRAIAHILGSLDDKIEANRRQNETLEAIARAIFRSWFVDFDPVHAKARGEQPAGMDAATAALFPDRFEDSALGPIPAGWRVGNVGDFGRIITGKTPSSKVPEYYGGEIPFVRIPDMHGRVFVHGTEKYLTKSGSKSQRNKLLPAYSVCVSCIASPGIVSLLAYPSHTNQQINCIVCSNTFSPFFVYFSLKLLHNEIVALGSGGSATLNLNKREFSRIRVLIPQVDVIGAFSKLVAPFFVRMLTADKESRTLAETRDALLPKLVSGEIRVGGVE